MQLKFWLIIILSSLLVIEWFENKCQPSKYVSKQLTLRHSMAVPASCLKAVVDIF